MILVGITGSIGCGKTTIAEQAKKLGFAVYNLDAWVRMIYCNKDFLIELKKEFPTVFDADKVNKKALRKEVFLNKDKLNKLESLIYPYLEQKIKRVITKNAKKDFIYFLDAPLLFEKKWDKYCDLIIVADVDDEIQKQRVMKRDKITEAEFERINKVQMDKNKKRLLADVVINTDKSLNQIKTDLLGIVKGII